MYTFIKTTILNIKSYILVTCLIEKNKKKNRMDK